MFLFPLQSCVFPFNFYEISCLREKKHKKKHRGIRVSYFLKEQDTSQQELGREEFAQTTIPYIYEVQKLKPEYLQLIKKYWEEAYMFELGCYCSTLNSSFLIVTCFVYLLK